MAPKVGTIIDHNTGKGIPGAIVVAEGYVSSPGDWGGSGGGCSYLVIGATDDNGRYRLPSTFHYFHWGFPGSGNEQQWRMYMSKDGHIQANAKLPLPSDSGGDFQRLIPIWNSYGRQTQWRGFEVEIPPVELMQFDASFEQKIGLRWYAGLSQIDGCGAISPGDLETVRSMNKAFYLEQEQYVCEATSNQTTNDITVQKLFRLAPHRQKFEAQLLQVAPSFLAFNRENTYRYPLADLCTAMKAGE